MMIYKNAQYVNTIGGKPPITGISVQIDGVLSAVPIDPANTDYANMMQLVESGDLTIKPAEESNNQ
jgi:hypothetical protein